VDRAPTSGTRTGRSSISTTKRGPGVVERFVQSAVRSRQAGLGDADRPPVGERYATVRIVETPEEPTPTRERYRALPTALYTS
jgi:hypothetical protein